MTDKKPKAANDKDAKKARLEAALRANIKRRKAGVGNRPAPLKDKDR